MLIGHVASYWIAKVAIIAIFWWLWHPLGVAAGIFAMGSLRQLISKAAPFWATTAILIVGVALGDVMAVIVYSLTTYVTPLAGLKIALYILGFLSVAYIGFEPRPEDIYEKAPQTATIAAACYVVTLFALVVVRGF